MCKKKRKDGFYPVYIRVIHHKKIAYIKTEKMVTQKGLSRNMEIEDPYVMKYCMERIVEYMDALNKQDIEHWDVKDVVEYILNSKNDISFSDYARLHHDRMIDAGQKRNARNYELAYQHLERFAGTNNVMFSRLTSTFISGWIKSLDETRRAKEMYPICIRQIFKAACVEYNDYDNGIIRIKTNPWVKVKIPAADRPEKLAITPEQCREFFSAPLPETKMLSPLPELGRDVAMMVLCLGGINTVDLFELRKSDYEDGIIKYKRAKTKKFRADDAYMEMRVPIILQPLMEKYISTDPNDEYLFVFHKRHSSSDSFGANVNTGIRKICESMGIPKEKDYCVYTFRHTWGTIAQNDCGASIPEVAFAMNHSSGHTVTRGYIKIDYSPAWELNEKVVDLIFFTDKESHREDKKEDNSLRISPKYLIHGTMFFRGRILHEIEDIGFNNKEEMIAELAKYIPDDIPDRSMIQFKIENKDKEQVAIYERMKGKGV